MRLNRRRLGTARVPGRIPLAILFLVTLGWVVFFAGGKAGHQQFAGREKAARMPAVEGAGAAGRGPRVLAAYDHLPMVFEPNLGQTDTKVKFLAHGSGYGLFLTGQEAVLRLQGTVGKNRRSSEGASVLSMALANANPSASIAGADALPGRSNYFIGNDSSKWLHDVPHYARVRYRQVYPGIDLAYYGNQGKLEYDFDVAPGGDPKLVSLRFSGVGNLHIEPNGDLAIAMNGGTFRLEAPQVYQTLGTQKQAVDGRFELRANNEVGFAIGAYDHSRALVIDPILVYSTYLGGSKDEACSVILGTGTPVSGCPAVAVDTESNTYIAGTTDSTDFPTTGSPYQSSLKVSTASNVFVSKFDSTATILVFSTYLGGTGIDTTAGVAVDPNSNVIVAGTTSSTNFPTANAFQSAAVSVNKHVFVSKLDPTGHSLLYSTYLSGNGVDTATGLAVDTSGSAYVTGTTTSTEVASSTSGFPANLGSYQTAPATGSTIQFFLTKVNPNFSGTSSVPYSTYFGGGNTASGAPTPAAVGGGVALDPNNNVFITGGTNFLRVGGPNDFPILNAYQGCLDTLPTTTTTTTTCSSSETAYDAFVAKFNLTATTGAQLLYSTYVGGTGNDIAYGVAADSNNAYITGSTTSTDFPAAGSGVFQTTHNAAAGNDAYVAKIANPVTTGTTAGLVTLSYFTYIGGSGDDVGLAITLDNNGVGSTSTQGARITGWTDSLDFPILNSNVQSGYGGGASDAFVARIDTTATTATAPGHYATYLGGSGNDYGTSIASDIQGASYVAGETSSANLMTAAPPQTNSFDSSLNGGTDAFLSKLGPIVSMGLTVTPSVTTVGAGNQVTFTYTITNNGDFTNGITFSDNLLSSPGTAFVSATGPSNASCGGASGNVVGCTIGSLNSGVTATITVVLTPNAATTPATSAVQLTNCATVSVAGTSFSTSACSNPAVVVNDFNIAVAPKTATVPAGVPATFTVTVTPTGNIPSSVTISCSSGLPTGATCPPGNNNPIPNLDNGPASTLLVINTVARVTTTTHLWQKVGVFYAAFVPICGLTLLGVGIGRNSKRRRMLMALLLGGFFSLVLFQASCGSTKTITTTTGTPAGTYIVTISAVSGATRTTTVTLIVQ